MAVYPYLKEGANFKLWMAIYTLVISLGIILLIYMFFFGIISIHEYGLGKVLWSVIATVIATAIIAFIALLLFNLAEQIYSFFYSLYDELVTRYMQEVDTHEKTN